MGPVILFDKSAIQGLGHNALAEVSHYFYTVVPHVLLMEALADLSLMSGDLLAAQNKVAVIASKFFPIDSIANAHYHTMCVHNLLGDDIPMARVPAVAGAKPIDATDSSKGMFIDVQPENEAVLRWRSGQFNSDDMKVAIEWRNAVKRSNLEEMKQSLPNPPIKLKSPEEVRDFVDFWLVQQEVQTSTLIWFMNHLRFDEAKHQRILVRWKFEVNKTLSSFAPYAYHCLRVQLIYYVGMLQGVFGTRPSNIVDLEYLCYTPFASVFCSGDKLHKQLAPLILEQDQSFVPFAEIHKSLNDLASERESDTEAEPAEDSLIHNLWQKHWKKEAINSRRSRPITKEQSEAFMKEVRPIIDALESAKDAAEQKPRFPK